MLPRHSRLSREGFDALMRARKTSSSHFAIAHQENSLYSGCGVVVSKKVARLAVSRHLIKRRIYSILKPFCTETRALAVFVRPGAKDLSFSEIEEELTALLKEARIS
ncbi:ribonuclease P protein component [Patescibacteria group bacterium]|nr:ribonuclease P protein component [Patescibacteria group bacterium]MBU1754765.1 ribonuclease P protein component [Patescibacteria group bacterium]